MRQPNKRPYAPSCHLAKKESEVQEQNTVPAAEQGWNLDSQGSWPGFGVHVAFSFQLVQFALFSRTYSSQRASPRAAFLATQEEHRSLLLQTQPRDIPAGLALAAVGPGPQSWHVGSRFPDQGSKPGPCIGRAEL